MKEIVVQRETVRYSFSLDPRTKVLFMALITTLMFFVYENIVFVSILALIPFLLLLENKQIKFALIYGLLFLMAIFAIKIKNVLVLPQILNAIIVLLIALVMRLFPTFMMGYYIISSTKVSEFICAMEKAHISKNFIIPMTVIFRFIPTIIEESIHIRNAMKIRGVRFGTKKFFKNPGLLLEYRFIPLIMSIVKIGDELSAAALTRGLGSSEKRTNVTEVKFGINDAIVFILSIFLLLSYIWCKRRGLV